MPTLRRYLRVSKYTVLETRIFLDDAHDVPWLTSSRTNTLAAVFAAIKPFVLPKLVEEQAQKKRSAAIKDTVSTDDFEVSVFLTPGGSRHAVLTKNVDFAANREAKEKEVVVREESGDDEEVVVLDDIPEAAGDEEQQQENSPPLFLPQEDEQDNDEDAGEDGDSDFEPAEGPSRTKKRKRAVVEVSDDDSLFDGSDDEAEKRDKKQLRTSYEGFGIYGRMLCLVIKRKDKKGKGTQQQSQRGFLEGWIQMSQSAKEDGGTVDDS